jgi:hypothetical protein
MTNVKLQMNDEQCLLVLRRISLNDDDNLTNCLLFHPVRADHMNITALALPGVDLLLENPAGKLLVALNSAARFIIHRILFLAPEKRVKDSILT